MYLIIILNHYCVITLNLQFIHFYHLIVFNIITVNFQFIYLYHLISQLIVILYQKNLSVTGNHQKFFLLTQKYGQIL